MNSPCPSGTWLNLPLRRGNPCQTSLSVLNTPFWALSKTNKQTNPPWSLKVSQVQLLANLQLPPPHTLGLNLNYYASTFNILKSTFSGFYIIVLMKKFKNHVFKMIQPIFDQFFLYLGANIAENNFWQILVFKCSVKNPNKRLSESLFLGF